MRACVCHACLRAWPLLSPSFSLSFFLSFSPTLRILPFTHFGETPEDFYFVYEKSWFLGVFSSFHSQRFVTGIRKEWQNIYIEANKTTSWTLKTSILLISCNLKLVLCCEIFLLGYMKCPVAYLSDVEPAVHIAHFTRHLLSLQLNNFWLGARGKKEEKGGKPKSSHQHLIKQFGSPGEPAFSIFSFSSPYTAFHPLLEVPGWFLVCHNIFTHLYMWLCHVCVCVCVCVCDHNLIWAWVQRYGNIWNLEHPCLAVFPPTPPTSTCGFVCPSVRVSS